MFLDNFTVTFFLQKKNQYMGFFQVAKLQIFYVLKLLGIISMWQEN